MIIIYFDIAHQYFARFPASERSQQPFCMTCLTRQSRHVLTQFGKAHMCHVQFCSLPMQIQCTFEHVWQIPLQKQELWTMAQMGTCQFLQENGLQKPSLQHFQLKGKLQWKSCLAKSLCMSFDAVLWDPASTDRFCYPWQEINIAARMATKDYGSGKRRGRPNEQRWLPFRLNESGQCRCSTSSV